MTIKTQIHLMDVVQIAWWKLVGLVQEILQFVSLFAETDYLKVRKNAMTSIMTLLMDASNAQ